MTRDEAETSYVDVILARGNPAFFVWKAVYQMSDQELIDSLSEMQIDIDEIESEY